MNVLLQVLGIVGGLACLGVALAFILAVAVKAFDIFAKLFNFDY